MLLTCLFLRAFLECSSALLRIFDEAPSFMLLHRYTTRFASRAITGGGRRYSSTRRFIHFYFAPPPPARHRHGTLEIHRLLVSAFIHGDDMHLYYNMASFLLKGVSLELTMGSQAYGGLLVFSLVVSQTLLLLCSWLLMTVFDAPEAMYACTVGFSGVLFALKYVLNRRSPGSSTVSNVCVVCFVLCILCRFCFLHFFTSNCRIPVDGALF